MIEVLNLFRANGYKTYIVTGPRSEGALRLTYFWDCLGTT